MDWRPVPRKLGLALAVLATAVLLGSGVGWLGAIAVLVTWVGSLWLCAAQPPQQVSTVERTPFSKKNLRAILELSASPLVLTEKGAIAIANRAARDIIGQHLLGQDARMAFRSPDAIELLNTRAGGTCTMRNFVRPRDCWQMRRQVIDGTLAIIELTDKSAETAMSRVHTDFVANASHELRTPLASIIGYVETLRDGGDDMPQAVADRFLATIEREARRLQALVSDLMSLSRIEAEKHEPPAAEVRLADLVERAAKDAAADDEQARLSFDLDHTLLVHGDEQQLEQVVRNLVDNAFKYGSGSESITLTLKRYGQRHLRLTVVDRGPGIAPEHLPHLTRRFYRTDPGRSRVSGGTGLGLAIVKHIVDRHKGRLDIFSRVGQGTRVSVRLPLARVDASDDPHRPGQQADDGVHRDAA